MHINKRKSLRTGAVMVSLVALLVISLMRTYAWLEDSSATIMSIFLPCTVKVKVDETDTKIDKDDNPLTNTYKMKIGEDIKKDPIVTIPMTNIDCFAFVKLEKSNNFDTYLTYEVDDSWTKLETTSEDVYWRQVYANGENQNYPVLKDNTVKLRSVVTEEMLNRLEDKPELRVTAYAIQQETFNDAPSAWAQLEKENK